MVLAAVLLIIAVATLGVVMIGLAAKDGHYGIDFRYWYMAASDVNAGISPYPRSYLASPVPALDFGYKYPPTFAQVIVPLTALQLPAATASWALIQLGLGFAAVWLATVLGGARKTLENALWSGLVTAVYYPFFYSIYHGNVSAVQAFQVSLLLAGGAVAGISLTTAVLLKTTPFALVPAALVHGGRLRGALVVSALLLAGLSIAAAPQAWLDFARIQPNLFVGANVHPHGIHPASLAAAALPDVPVVASMVRLVTLVLAVTMLVSSVVAARRPDGWPAAVVLGVTAALIIPGAVWYHYLAMLLPLAAFAWPRAKGSQRAVLFSGVALVTLATAWLPLATVGAGVMVAATLHVLAPRSGRRILDTQSTEHAFSGSG